MTTHDDEIPPALDGGTIAGRVTDFDGFPLVGVRVEAAAAAGGELDLLPVMTSGDGSFMLDGLGAGPYDLRFVLGRVRARTLSVPVGTEDLAVRLARPQGILLVVKTEGFEAPPDIFHVRIERETKAGWRREYEGRQLTSPVLFWSLRPATYRVTVWGGCWLPVEAHGIEVKEGVPAPEVQIVLAVEGGEARGFVRDATGRPVPHALVTWRSLDDEGPWPLDERCTDADSDGRFRIVGLPPGTYRVSGGPLGGPFGEVEVEIEAGQAVDLQISP